MRASGKAVCLAAACLLFWPGLGLTQRQEPIGARVVVDGQTQQVCSTAGTVGELLIELGVTLGDLDRTSPPLTARLEDGAVVRVNRISCREVVEQAPVKAEPLVLAAPKMGEGQIKVLRKGKDGLVRRVVQVWSKDGEVTQRSVLREKVLSSPEAAVVLRGTAGMPSRGGEMRTALRMHATAYVAGHCGGSSAGRTATGIKAAPGVVAVDPRVITLGTRLYIPNYGFALAADTGSAIKGNRIDLCVASDREAAIFGRRTIDVYVLR